MEIKNILEPTTCSECGVVCLHPPTPDYIGYPCMNPNCKRYVGDSVWCDFCGAILMYRESKERYECSNPQCNYPDSKYPPEDDPEDDPNMIWYTMKRSDK